MKRPGPGRTRSPRGGRIAAGIVGVALILAGCTSSTSAHRTATTLPVVRTSTVPSGWSPVTFGDAQIAVPSNWVIELDGIALCSRLPGAGDGAVYLITGALKYDGPACTHAPASEVLVSRLPAIAHIPRSRSIRVNSIPVEVPILSDQNGPINYVRTTYFVPTLGVEITAAGPLSLKVLGTLTHSPLSVVMANGPQSRHPSSWQTVRFGGITMSVPGSWSVVRVDHLPCEVLVPSQVLLFSSPQGIANDCPGSLPIAHAQAGIPGAFVSAGSPAPFDTNQGTLGTLVVNGLELHVSKISLTGNLFAASVDVPSRLHPTFVMVGMTGDGQQARAVVHSILPAGS